MGAARAGVIGIIAPLLETLGARKGPEGAFSGSLLRNKRLLKQLATLKEGPL